MDVIAVDAVHAVVTVVLGSSARAWILSRIVSILGVVAVGPVAGAVASLLVLLALLVLL